ncbi:uncharacterized protein [Physcomitrium patens]|uniref:uncharacterized protein isoform X2 n=1 Tax=Physcomitrium patens TaxID=3218 RepID=UPI000D17A981|nr:uncharacterized protein LOC112287570 isoform X2 [Physcomitrium patens]|eukprot:XP_024386445.1 uncharacterized protein LOC112287570 isoform X2 [Physcomitrella patens]
MTKHHPCRRLQVQPLPLRPLVTGTQTRPLQLADGMTVHVTTVNLMLETCGGRSNTEGGAAWKPPLASLTIRNLCLYTTNEHWKVVPLNQARDFNNNTRAIYVFKKLEWESLSVDLLPHPDMFSDEQFMKMGRSDSRDKDGAKRLFFGGERFLDSISGYANITMCRSEQNANLGLEVQLHIPDVLIPALSEPGLRALLRFMTGVYVCMNRGDVNVRSKKSEAAGRSMIGVRIDHIFLCIKDAEFQVEFLLQSLLYVRASSADGECMRTMSRIIIGCLFLRDTFSQPSCTLVQPSMRDSGSVSAPYVPSFASDKLWPRIYPLEDAVMPQATETSMICVYSVQTAPAPAPPNLASQTVVQCQPLKINLQEETCLRIASFLSDGINVEPGLVLPEASLNAMHFSLKEFDLTVPLNAALLDEDDMEEENGFTGARLHVEGFMIAQSPFLGFRLLNLEKDAACFTMWKGQPVDSSQQRWVMRASHLSIALETSSCNDNVQNETAADWAAGLWRCVEMHELHLESAMATADGGPLIDVPPPGGIVRLGISCKKYVSNTSSEQFLFVLKMYTYLGIVSDMLLRELKPVTQKKTSKSSSFKELKRAESLQDIAEIVPADMAVYLSLKRLEVKFLESVPGEIATEGPPLVQISSRDIDFTATHQMLAAAAVISSNLCWQDIRVDCVETELSFPGAVESHYGSPLTHISGIRDSFDASTLGSPSGNPLITDDGVDSSGSCGDSFIRPTPLKLSPLARGLERCVPSQGLPEMRGVFWIGEERGSMAPTGPGEINGTSSSGRLPFLDICVKNVIPFKEQDAECHSLSINAKVGGVRLGGGMAYNEALLHRFGVFGADGGPGPGVEKVIKNLTRGSLANLFRPSPDVGTARKGDRVRKTVEEPTWDSRLPDDIEFEIHLLDWLFALEGANGVFEPEETFITQSSHSFREDRCWHSTFRCLSLKAQGTKEGGNLIAARHGKKSSPVQSLVLKIEGLQALKPRVIGNSSHQIRDFAGNVQMNSSVEYLDCGGADFSYCGSPNPGQSGAILADNISGLRDIGSSITSSEVRLESSHLGSFSAADPSVTSKSGFDFEIQLEEPEDDDGMDIGMGGWVVKICKAAVREPVEVGATRVEVEYMVELFKSEIESASRIAAGGLRLLQLHKTIGHSAIDQLTHFGGGGLDRVLTPGSREKSRRFSDGSVSSLPSFRKSFKKENTLSKLEASISETETLCSKLYQQLSLKTDSATAAELKLLVDQIKSSQTLLGNLKNEL